jgi:hypothetical protein
MLKVKTQRFTDADVIFDAVREQYYVVMYHNIGNQNYLVSVTDNDGNIRNTSNLFVKDDNQTLIKVPGQTIGAWTCQVYYEDGSQQDLSKKRLFEQDLIPLEELPNYLDFNVAMGRPNSPTVNMSLANLKSFCQSTLDTSIYLLKSNNLSDLNSVANARQNLNVYDKAYIDSYITSFIPKNGYIDTISQFTASGDTTYSPVVSSVKGTHGVNVYLETRLTGAEGATTAGINLGYIDVSPVTGSTFTANTITSVLFTWFTTSSATTTSQIFTEGELKVTPSALGGGRIRFTFTAYINRPSGQTNIANCSASIFIPLQIN